MLQNSMHLVQRTKTKLKTHGYCHKKLATLFHYSIFEQMKALKELPQSTENKFYSYDKERVCI